MDDRKRQRANNDKTSSTTTTFTSSSSTSLVPNPLPTIISCWTPLHLLDSPLEPLELAATAPKKQKTTDTTCITCLEPQYVVCTDDVESSGRFLSEVLVDGKFLGTIRNQTTFKQALSLAEIGGGTLFIVGHSDKNFGYICKGKILISKALSLAQSKVDCLSHVQRWRSAVIAYRKECTNMQCRDIRKRATVVTVARQEEQPKPNNNKHNNNKHPACLFMDL